MRNGARSYLGSALHGVTITRWFRIRTAGSREVSIKRLGKSTE